MKNDLMKSEQIIPIISKPANVDITKLQSILYVFDNESKAKHFRYSHLKIPGLDFSAAACITARLMSFFFGLMP